MKNKDNSFLNFLQFKGKTGRKDVIFLSCGYLLLLVFLLLISLFGENDLPIELTYAVIGLPFVFFGFAFVFWMLKRLFSFLYQRIALLPFVIISSFLFILWNGIISWIFLESRYHSDLIFIPIVIWLAVTIYLMGLMIWNMLEKLEYASFNIKLIYVFVNLVIVCSTCYFFIIQDIKIQNVLFKSTDTSGYLNMYVECLTIHLILYTMFWLAGLLKGFVFLFLGNKKIKK